MALGIADFTAQLAALQAQFKAGTITEEQLADGLRDLWTASENIPALFDQMQAVIDVKAAILTAWQAALNVKGQVTAVSGLPAEAEDRDAYQLVNPADPLDGHLFTRVAGVWTDIGPLGGERGASAFEVAKKVAEDAGETPPADEAAFIQELKQPAIDAAEAADEVRIATQAVQNDTLEVKEQAEAVIESATNKIAETEDVRAATDLVREDTLEAKTEALAAAAAANLARDRASFKAVYATKIEIDADLAHDEKVFGIVYNDANPANNGTYIKAGAAGAGSWNKADTTGGLAFQTMAIETGYIGGFVDTVGRPCWLVKPDGTLVVMKVQLPDESIVMGWLATAIRSLLLADPSLQAMFAVKPVEGPGGLSITDSAGHAAAEVNGAGETWIYKPRFPANAIELGALPASLATIPSDVAARLLASSVLATVLQTFGPEQDGTFAVADNAGHTAAEINSFGETWIYKPRFPANAIQLAALPAFLALLPSDAPSRLLATAAVVSALQSFTPEQPGFLSITDNTGHTAAEVNGAGETWIYKPRFPAGAIQAEALPSSVLNGLLPTSISSMLKLLPPETGYSLAIVDETTGRIAFGIPIAGLPIAATVTRAQSAAAADNAAGSTFSTGGARENAGYLVVPYTDGSGKRQLRSIRKSDGKVFNLTSAGNNIDPVLTSDNKVMFWSDASGAGMDYWIPVEGGAAYPLVALSTVTCWGDSLTAGAGSTSGLTYPAQLATALGRTVNNRGIGGQTSTSIIARQGGITAPMTVTSDQIPASGPVAVTAHPNSPITNQGSASFTGTLAGVPGTLSRDVTTGDYSFTRTTAGSVVSCPAGTPFIFDLALAAQSDTQVIWVGRNDGTGALATTRSNVASAVGFLKPYAKRYLTLGVTTKSDGTENSGSAAYTAFVAHNTTMAGLYGSFTFDGAGLITGETAGSQSTGLFLDIRRYLIDYGLAIAGITPTSQDTTDIANDVIPTSLLSPDLLHFNNAGYLVIASVIAQIITWKGW
jgi:hypothetical protein